jgi:hypothetical protein
MVELPQPLTLIKEEGTLHLISPLSLLLFLLTTAVSAECNKGTGTSRIFHPQKREKLGICHCLAGQGRTLTSATALIAEKLKLTSTSTTATFFHCNKRRHTH